MPRCLSWQSFYRAWNLAVSVVVNGRGSTIKNVPTHIYPTVRICVLLVSID